MSSKPLARPIESALRSLIHQKLGSHGLTNIAISAESDHDGDPALLIELTYDNRGARLEPGSVKGLTSELRSILWSNGEERFPHIRHVVGDDRTVGAG